MFWQIQNNLQILRYSKNAYDWEIKRMPSNYYAMTKKIFIKL